MQFAGTVRPVPGRGSLDLSGRTFRLTGGDIDLNGPVDSTRLDVTAEYQVPTQGGGEDEGVVITVEAKGRLDSLGLEFSSEPSMSQEDVLSYIVTGHPASDNPLESSGPGLSGKQMVYGQLSQALSTTAGQAARLRRLPDQDRPGQWSEPHRRTVPLEPVLPQSEAAAREGVEQRAGRQSRSGVRAGILGAALAARRPAGRQPRAGHSVPWTACVLVRSRWPSCCP